MLVKICTPGDFSSEVGFLQIKICKNVFNLCLKRPILIMNRQNKLNVNFESLLV